MGILGPSKKEAWNSFADSMGANVIDAGAFKGGVKVRLMYKNWEVLMDTYTVSTGKSSTTYTRVRSVYVSNDDFDFKIFKTNIFTKMARSLGRVYAPTGDEEFDGVFSIRSINEGVIKKIFNNDQLKEMIFNIKKVYFLIKKAKGRKETKSVENERELHYYTVGIIKDIEQLTLIFGVMINMLDAFKENDIAKSEAPQISYLR